MARRQGQAYWQKHLEAWFQSDLTQEAYCTQNGLSTKSFYRWRRKETGKGSRQRRRHTGKV